MKRPLLILSGFLLCVLVSFGVKTYHFNREAARMARHIGDAPPLWHGLYSRSGLPTAAGIRDFLPEKRPNFLPFTIESAMMYAYAQDIASGRGVPSRDPRLAYMPDVPPYAQMNMALEWVLGWSYRFLSLFRKIPAPSPRELAYQDMPDFAAFTAVSIRLWTALIPGLIFLYLILLRTPFSFSLFAGLLHAVSCAAIARATGQDIVRGDLCITLFLMTFVLAEWTLLRPARWKELMLVILTVFSFAAWDLCQMLFGVWGAYEVIRWCIGGTVTCRRRRVWLMISLGIVLTALLVPFHVTYGLIMSELVCILLPLLAFVLFFPKRSWKVRLPAAGAVLLLLFLNYHFFIDNPSFRDNYSHFSEAMKAKIAFDNVKPADPSLLSYDARIMWTPAMHSADWGILLSFFPSPGGALPFRNWKGPVVLSRFWNGFPLTLGLFYLLLLGAGLWTPLRCAVGRDLARSLAVFLGTAGFTVGFAYAVRYHEFLIIFLSLSFGFLLHEYSRALRGDGRLKTLFFRLTCRILPVLLILFELTVSLCFRMRVYGDEVYLRETAELIRWFRSSGLVRNRTVLTEFTAGPMLMAYCGAGIVLQPQFGMIGIRKPVEEYLNIMFHGTAEDLDRFCRKYKVDYLIYDLGMTNGLHPYSVRYIANAREIRPLCPANLFLRVPRRMKHFFEVTPPPAFRRAEDKFRVFRFTGRED